MATIQFRIRSQANKNVSIKIYLSTGRGNLTEVNTGFTINPKDWSDTTNRPKQTTPENKVLSQNLKKLDSFVSSNLNADIGNGILIDRYWLENQIKKCFNRVEKSDRGLLANHIQFIIDNAKTRKVKGRKNLGLSESRIKSYVTFKGLVQEYQSEIKKSLNFLDINKSFVERFTDWLLNKKKYSVNYAGKQLDNLKTVSIDAEKIDIPVNEYINQISGFSESDEDRFIVTLSTQELQLIQEAEITNSALNNARNWILIGCELGQRAGDLLNLTTDNIRHKGGNIYVDIVQQKTKKPVTMGVIAPHVIEIIENNFPHKISTQKLNEYIKEVCKIAGIVEVIQGKKLNPETGRKELGLYPKHELITTHSFRRSFATNYYKRIPTAILIGITGHSKESLFLSYINKREDKDSNADLFMKFYEEINKDKTPQLKIVG